MRIHKKFLFLLMGISLLINLLYLNYFEANASSFIEDMEKDASSFIDVGKNTAGSLEPVTNSITENFTGLGQLLTMIGAGVMVAVVSYMGVKYIISPPDKQAALKQQLIGVVVAGIVIFGAYGIWKAVLGVVSNF